VLQHCYSEYLPELLLSVNKTKQHVNFVTTMCSWSKVDSCTAIITTWMVAVSLVQNVWQVEFLSDGEMGQHLFIPRYRNCKNFINILFMKDCYSDQIRR